MLVIIGAYALRAAAVSSSLYEIGITNVFNIAITGFSLYFTMPRKVLGLEEKEYAIAFHPDFVILTYPEIIVSIISKNKKGKRILLS